MKFLLTPLLAFLTLHITAVAQNDVPLLSPEERRAVDAQDREFNAKLAPALAEAAKSTVRIWAGNRRLAYGTVIEDGSKVITKWSEVARYNANLRVEGAEGVVFVATITGVYEDEDVAVLELNGTPLTPVKWEAGNLKLGTFLATPQPDGRTAAFGVVSVLERNLRDTDYAYLGVIGELEFAGPGVRIREVDKDSGAAAAGLKPGNIILKVGERQISGMLELRNALVSATPGMKVSLLVRNGKAEKNVDIILGNRPNLPNFPGHRLAQMERMGGPISQVGDSFTRAIQTDMRPQPNQIGGPVVDLEGRVVGITLARAGRTRSFVMPSAAVQDMLAGNPRDPTLVRARSNKETPAIAARNVPAPGRMNRNNPESQRHHLSELQRLMDMMDEEMDALGPDER